MKKTLVLTVGTFRFNLHPGHINFLNECKSLGDRLIVLIDDEDRVEKTKGLGSCLLDNIERNICVSNLKSVYGCRFFIDEPHKIKTIKEEWKKAKKQGFKRLIFAKSADYTHETIVERNLINILGGTVVILQHYPEYSTTQIIKQIRNANIIK